MRCVTCGADMARDGRFCNWCGTPAAPTSFPCPQCALPLSARARFCVRCGVDVERATAPAPKPSKAPFVFLLVAAPLVLAGAAAAGWFARSLM
jgi:hypothetical protein